MSVQMKFSDKDIHDHWQELTAELERRGLVTGYAYQPKGYSYFLRNPVQHAQVDNAYLVGDAAGLATWDLAEGIGPAVRSAILAAESIVAGKPYSLASVTRYSAANALLAFPFKYLFINKSEAAARRLKAEPAAG
jgi:flavin-dependent dehydrogenase